MHNDGTARSFNTKFMFVKKVLRLPMGNLTHPSS